MFKIITDSTSDLSKDLRTKYDIDYVHMCINIGDVELKASLDWEEYSSKEFYNWMRDGKIIKTTQVPYSVIIEKFSSYLSKGMDVLYVACSSALSGSCNVALSACEELNERYPNNKVVVIDSLIASLGEGHLAITAAKLQQEGLDIDSVAKHLNDMKLKVNQICTVASLEYLKRAGRVKTTTAFFGNIFGVKPLIISDVRGNNYAFMKVKGRRTSLLSLIDYTKENIIDPSKQTLYVVHSDALDDAIFLKEHLVKNNLCRDVIIGTIGPIVGASTGPGTVAIYFEGKEVTMLGE